MIRLTVEQLMALRDSIQAGGQVHCAVLPLVATYSHRLIIAWAKGPRNDEEYYLSIWKDTKSLDKARQEDEEGQAPPYDYTNDPVSQEYSHTYPVEEFGNRVAEIARGPLGSSADSGHPEFGVPYGE